MRPLHDRAHTPACFARPPAIVLPSPLKAPFLPVPSTERFKDRLVDEGYNPAYGARPLRRAIMRLLEDSMAERMLAGDIKEGDSVIIDGELSTQARAMLGCRAILWGALWPLGIGQLADRLLLAPGAPFSAAQWMPTARSACSTATRRWCLPSPPPPVRVWECWGRRWQWGSRIIHAL